MCEGWIQGSIRGFQPPPPPQSHYQGLECEIIPESSNHEGADTLKSDALLRRPIGFVWRLLLRLFALRCVSALFCAQNLFFLSSAFHTLHFSALQKTQRNAECRSKMQNSAFSVEKRIRPRAVGVRQMLTQRSNTMVASLVVALLGVCSQPDFLDARGPGPPGSRWIPLDPWLRPLVSGSARTEASSSNWRVRALW